MISSILDVRGTADDLRARLNELAVMDKAVEEKIRKANRLITICGIISGILFFAVCMGAVFLLPLLLVSLFLLLPLLIHRSMLNAQNLEDRKIETAREFFSVMRNDIPSRKICSLYTNFQGYQKHGKLMEKKSEGFLGSVRHSTYADCWFLSSGALHDGNTFKMSIVQTAKRTEKSKRKYTKVTEVLREKVKLIVRIDRSTYPKADMLPALIKTPGSVAGLTIRNVAVNDSLLRIIAETEPCRNVRGRYGTSGTGTVNLTEGKKLVALFLFLYGHLNKCR